MHCQSRNRITSESSVWHRTVRAPKSPDPDPAANAPLAGTTRALRWATPTHPTGREAAPNIGDVGLYLEVLDMLKTGQNIALNTEERPRDDPRCAIDDHIAKHRGCNTEDDGGTSGEWR